MTQELATTPDNAQLAPIDADEQALIDSIKGQVDTSKLVLPALKLGQGLTDEVQDGPVEQGEFFNSLTGEVYGTEVELVVSAIFEGRFYSDGEGKGIGAQGDVAPDHWPEQYRGQHFADIPDAEEQWSAAANAGDHPWGEGPPISTTHNFVGLVVGDETGLPVRLSLMRTNNPAAAKLQTLIYAARAPWDRSFVIKSKRETGTKGNYYVIEVAQGGVTEPELRQEAVKLAADYKTASEAGNVELTGDEAAEKPKRGRSKPKDDGGLAVS